MSLSLTSLSPLDGRYQDITKPIAACFSEKALIQRRIKIEIEYLIALGAEKGIKELPRFSEKEQNELRNIYKDFNSKDAQKVKVIEQTTKHDVKAVEYFLQTKTQKSLHSWLHFAITSEDVNNLAYSLMWKEGLNQVYLPQLVNVHDKLKLLAKKHVSQAMLSMTHGQPATPTTFGKELAVYTHRLKRQIDQIKTHVLLAKFNGATGTWAAHNVAYPNVGWIEFSKRFIISLGLKPNILTTQVESRDSLAESFHQIARVNTILKDLTQNLWLYISRGILTQKPIKTETGSSTMPHKINPIHFENAEGNFGVSTSLFYHLAEKLPTSRMQRDLSDSTVIRNCGSALGYTYVALHNLLQGLNKITVNKVQMDVELDNHWAVLSEAVQTLLRKLGQSDAYEKLKELVRGKEFNSKILKCYIASLPISKEDKNQLLSLSPQKYTGLAEKIVKEF